MLVSGLDANVRLKLYKNKNFVEKNKCNVGPNDHFDSKDFRIR
jgi:hypothetical protein